MIDVKLPSFYVGSVTVIRMKKGTGAPSSISALVTFAKNVFFKLTKASLLPTSYMLNSRTECAL